MREMGLRFPMDVKPNTMTKKDIADYRNGFRDEALLNRIEAMKHEVYEARRQFAEENKGLFSVEYLKNALGL